MGLRLGPSLSVKNPDWGCCTEYLDVTGTESKRTAQKTVWWGASQFIIFIRRYQNDQVNKNVCSTVKHSLLSGHTLTVVALLPCSMLIYRRVQAKYTEKQRQTERERNYAKFLAKDTLYVSAYTFRTLLKRHVWMCTQCPDILTLRTAIQCTISDNCKGCEKVNHRMSDSRINTATINLLKPTG